jgi:hypothetical protein
MSQEQKAFPEGVKFEARDDWDDILVQISLPDPSINSQPESESLP